MDINYENDLTKDTISKLVDIVSNYDVYDFISRVAGLNLIPENQNKSVLLDALQQYIIEREKIIYTSTAKMSSGKFRNIINELNDTFLSASIDPCENTFIQNIMFGGNNYRVFNGIDNTPAYNLQVLIRILFQYKNDYPNEFLIKSYMLLSFVLGISEEIANKLFISLADIKYDEGKRIILPASDIVSDYAELIKLPVDKVINFIDGIFDISEIVIEFGGHDIGDLDNREFYTKPFLLDERSGQLIILNVSLLPMFSFYKIVEWSVAFGIKEKMLKRYNEYIWLETEETLKSLGHRKVDEKELGINCVINDYYKEMITTVYNNQLMLVILLCDDGAGYPKNGMHSKYPDDRHTKLFQNRMDYLAENVKIPKEDWYCVVIIAGFGRAMGVSLTHYPFVYKPIHLNPFELICIKIKERKSTGFLPRYIRAKSQLNMIVPGLISELNSMCLYTSNDYSFYISDDVDPYEKEIYIGAGDSIEYITEALIEENRMVVDSYMCGEKTEIICEDQLRNIYIESDLFIKKNVALYIQFENLSIWITTEEIKNYKQLNIYFSIADVIAYWLSECKDIMEQLHLPYRCYVIQIALFDMVEEYYYERENAVSFEDCILKEVECNKIKLKWQPEAFGNMNQSNNIQEKLLCSYLLNIFNDFSSERIEFAKELDRIFANPLKKKFYSFDYTSKPYLKQIEMGNKRKVHKEDEDYLSGIVGKELLNSGRWNIGIVQDEDRNKVSKEVVAWLYDRLQTRVAMLSGDNILEVICFDIEDTIYELSVAERGFYSEIECYPEREDRYIEKYNELNKTSVALKFLAEYITACPPKGNKHLGVGQYEELLAICSMIIEWAYKGDLFTYKIFNTPIEFLKSRRIGLKKDEFIEMYTYGDIYRRRQLKFNSSGLLRHNYKLELKDYYANLESAFMCEFGYKYSEFVQVVTAMIEFNNNDVICIDETKLKHELMLKDKDLSCVLIGKVLEDITYSSRDNYLKLPSKYKPWETYPWRFNRRYSFNRRPVMKKDNMLIWGNRQLYLMMEYVSNLIITGKFKAESDELRALIGKISYDRGEAFNKMIFNIINDFNEFELYANIKKINGKKISQPNGNDLGDIDILIIDDKKHTIIAAEVKDFHFSRNPYEIQQEYMKMFVDNENKLCFATKHRRRVEWIENHLSDIKAVYKLDDREWKVKGIFIVSEPLISSYIYKQTIKCISRAELTADAIREL